MIKSIPARSAMRQRVDDARRRAATTPGRLRMFSLAIAAVATAMMVIGAGSLLAALSTATTIQQHTVPSIVGMQHVHAWLSDADRSAASAFLAGGFESNVSQLQFDAESAVTDLDLLGRLNPDEPSLRFEADIAAASRELQRATDQNDADTEGTQRIQTLAQSIAYYTSLVRSASVQVGQDVTAGTFYLQAATNLMHSKGGLLAQADSLRDMYAAGLDGANVVLEVAGGMLILYAGTALGLLVLLVRTQRFVRTRFRRRRNSRLLAATTLVLIVSAGGMLGAVRSAQAIRVAESQSYIRMANLWNARALLYDANANETFSLIAAGRGGTFDQAFQTDTEQLVDRPLTDGMIQDAEQGEVRFNGLIADELRGADTPAERDAAMHALGAYQRFMASDASVRAQSDAAVRAQAAANARAQAQAPKGTKPAAVPRTPISDRPLVLTVDELDWYFGAAMQSIQRQFDATMQAAELTLTVTAGLELLALVVAALTFWGLQPRIDEYR